MFDYNDAPSQADLAAATHHSRDIRDEIAGREAEILQALGISIGRRGHQRCPLGTHEDKHPSWRWDARQARWHCTCGHGTAVDAVMWVQGVDAAAAIRWIRQLLDGAAPPARRITHKPPPAEPPPEETHAAVAAESARRWAAARPADPRHPYLQAKAVQPHGLRQQGNRLLVPLQDIAGRLWTIQTIAPDGTKLFGKGSRVGRLFSPIGLAGDPEQLIICEGWATAATLREATGLPVLAAMNAGNLQKVAEAARQAWPEADIIIAADNDRHLADNPGKTKGSAAAIAIRARLAVPQFAEDVPGTDFADLGDHAAVRAAIDAAEAPEPAPAAAIGTLSAEEAAERTRQAITRFFERALANVPETPDPLDFNPPLVFAMGVRGSLGLGKTQIALERMIQPDMADLCVNFYAPEHRLNGELLERFAAMAGPDAPPARIIYGREQVRPDGEAMCAKADLVRKIASLKVSVQSHLCERRRETGEIDPQTRKPKTALERCEHFASCAYQQQRADTGPGVRFLSHAHLFIAEAVPHADINIVDESFWQGALHGTDVRLIDHPDGIAASGGYCVSLGSLQLPRRDVGHATNADLVDLSQRCARAIYAGGRLQDFEAAGVTAEAAKAAMGTEYGRLETLAVSPAMPRARQEAAIGRYRQQEARRFARFFGLLAECLAAGVDPCADSLDLVRDVRTEDGVEDRIYLYWRAAVRAPKAPTLLLDANLEPEVARHFFPGLEEPTIAEARLQGYHATQIVDHSVPKSRLAPPAPLPDDVDDPERRARHLAEVRRRANRRGELRRLVEVEASKGETVCITYKSVREAIEAEGQIPNASFAHWNRLRGHDEWRNAQTLIVAGVPQPNAETIERMARALWHGDPTPIQTIPPDQYGRKRYQREPRLITMADGRTVPVAVDVHPDRRCTLLLDQIRAETMQAIGRARLVHRDPARPCRLIILTNYPLPIAMHETMTWDERMPNPIEVMAARNVIPQRLRDVAKVMPELVASSQADPRSTVAEALKAAGVDLGELFKFPYREFPIGEFEQLTPFRYRLAGERQSAVAWVNVTRADPCMTLESFFGPLSLCEPVDAPPASAELAAPEPPAPEPPSSPMPEPPPMPAPQPEPPPSSAHGLTAAQRALIYLRCWNIVSPLPERRPDLDYEALFIAGGTEAVLAAAFGEPPKPPRPWPISPDAPPWARRAMGYPVNNREARYDH